MRIRLLVIIFGKFVMIYAIKWVIGSFYSFHYPYLTKDQIDIKFRN